MASHSSPPIAQIFPPSTKKALSALQEAARSVRVAGTPRAWSREHQAVCKARAGSSWLPQQSFPSFPAHALVAQQPEEQPPCTPGNFQGTLLKTHPIPAAALVTGDRSSGRAAQLARHRGERAALTWNVASRYPERHPARAWPADSSVSLVPKALAPVTVRGKNGHTGAAGGASRYPCAC